MKPTKLIKSGLALALSAAVGTGLMAQEDAPDGLIIKNMGNGGTLKVSGYVDAYYQYNGNEPANSGVQGGETSGRIFDSQHNEFSLGLAQTMFEYTNKGVTTVVDLTYGPNAESGNFGNLTGTKASPNTASTTATSIKQAFVSAELIDGLSLTAGQFGTHVGYEIIEAYANSNYSLSNLFGYGPFYHQGAKLDYAVSDNIGVMVGIANGWDSSNTADNNSPKSVLAQLALTSMGPADIFINYVGGDETTEKGDKYRHIVDLTSTIGISDQLGLGLNAAYGVDAGVNTDAWYGAALYVDFTVNPGEETTHMISTRAEYFNDEKSTRTFGAEVIGLTLTYTLSMYNGAFMIKPELRYDQDLSKKGTYTNSANSQTTALVAFIGTY